MANANDPIELPFKAGIGYYRLGTSIGGTHYLIDVRWNASANLDANGVPQGAWYLDFFEQDETAIILGVKLVLGAYLGRRSNHPLFTNGVFVAIDMSNQGREAAFDDLGGRVIVQYIPVVELIRRIQDHG